MKVSRGLRACSWKRAAESCLDTAAGKSPLPSTKVACEAHFRSSAAPTGKSQLLGTKVVRAAHFRGKFAGRITKIVRQIKLSESSDWKIETSNYESITRSTPHVERLLFCGQCCTQRACSKNLLIEIWSAKLAERTCSENLLRELVLRNLLRGTRANNLRRGTCTENLLGELAAAANAFGLPIF